MTQIFWYVLGGEAKIYGSAGKRYGFVIECTPAEKIEIAAMFRHYWAAYERELDSFQRAFIMTNNLYSQDGESRDYDDLTQAEKDEFERVKRLAQGMDKSEFFKQLND